MRCKVCDGEMVLLARAVGKGMYKEKATWRCLRCGTQVLVKEGWENETFTLKGWELRRLCKYASPERSVVRCKKTGTICKFQCVRKK